MSIHNNIVAVAAATGGAGGGGGGGHGVPLAVKEIGGEIIMNRFLMSCITVTSQRQVPSR